jgi:hypothetical protein
MAIQRFIGLCQIQKDLAAYLIANDISIEIEDNKSNTPFDLLFFIRMAVRIILVVVLMEK